MTADAADLLLETLRFRDDHDIPGLRRRWATLNLAGLAALAEYEGCVLWLYRRLKALGLLDAIPGVLCRWLAARARHLAAQNLRVDAQSEIIMGLLNSYGVPHVLLKGTARRHAAEIYPYADARATSDVDVLLPSDLARPAWERLRAAGFEAAAEPARYEGHFHLPPLANDWGVKVELHTSTSLEVLPAEAWHRMSDSARVTRRAGGPMMIPSATELFWHALTHARAWWPHAFRVRLLQDAAVVWASGEEIDWGKVAARLISDEPGDIGLAKRWLRAAAWLAGIHTTDERLGDLPAFDLSHLLRWRLRVFRLFSFGGVRGSTAVWGPHAVSRCRRLLIEEGTRAELRLPLTPPPRGATSLPRAGRSVVAAAARLCYWGWRSFRRT